MLPINDQMLLEVQKHEKTLDQVIVFQNDQAQVNRALSQKLNSLETRMTKIEANQKRILDLLKSKTHVG